MAGERGDQAPLAGAVMCCTSILPDERSVIAFSAGEMGAEHKFDLTSDVTHLIVGGIDSSKYKYVARERPDVKVVLPAFIDAVKESWIEGGATDVAALEEQYRVPTFNGLIICVTGIESYMRDQVIKLVKRNGGEYHGDLTTKCTHLIAATPGGNKYDHARRWEIKIVGQEWLADCIERGMVLDETLYDPVLPPAARGKDAWKRQTTTSVVLGKRKTGEEGSVEAASNKRKLRRTMSAKLESQHEIIWADIATVGSGKAKQNEWQPQEMEDSILGHVEAPDPDYADVTPDPTIEPLRKKSGKTARSTEVISTKAQKRSFGGAITYVHGFESSHFTILNTHLVSHGARVCTTTEGLKGLGECENGYLITPHNIPEDKLPELPAGTDHLQRVTELWVESCMHQGKIMNPAEHPLCKPLGKLFIEGLQGVTVCSTGFKDMELLHLSKVVNLTGATYDEWLKRGISVLISNSASINLTKVDFAVENDIPVVSEKWLWACIECGSKQDFNEFPVETETPTVPVDYRPQHTKVRKQDATVNRPFKSTRSLQRDSKGPALDRRKGSIQAKELSLQPSRKHGPFVVEDDEEIPSNVVGVEARASTEPPLPFPSRPLKELSQEQVNSPKKSIPVASPGKSRPSSTHSTQTTTKPSGSAVSDTHLTDSIAALLAQKQASRQPSNPPESNLSRRRLGKLGRALSGSSHQSTNVSRSDSLPTVPSQLTQHEFSAEKEEIKEPPLPSQKIIYEDDKVVEERNKYFKKMGVQQVEAQSVNSAKSIGVVKDTVTDSGLGPRPRRRGR